jgi:hypothetical protein
VKTLHRSELPDHRLRDIARNKRDADDEVVTVAIPRSALTVVASPPVQVTQHNVEETLGLPRRTFLVLAREYARAGGVVLALGKLRAVSTEAFCEWLRRRAPGALEEVDETTNGAPESEDERLARELGLEVRPTRLAAKRAANSDDGSPESSAIGDGRAGSDVPCVRKMAAR